nr:PepSY domain-containing protein [Kaistia hirudinis]
MKKYIALTIILPALGFGGAGLAHAEDGNGTADRAIETQAFLSAKLSPSQALQAAETKMGGKATGVSFEGPAATPYYQVELIASNGTTQDVAVDAISGEVMKLAGSDEESGDAQDQQDAGDQGDNGENGAR